MNGFMHQARQGALALARTRSVPLLMIAFPHLVYELLDHAQVKVPVSRVASVRLFDGFHACRCACPSQGGLFHERRGCLLTLEAGANFVPADPGRVRVAR